MRKYASVFDRAFRVSFFFWDPFYSERRRCDSTFATPIVVRLAHTRGCNSTVYFSVDFHARYCTWQRICGEFHFLSRFNSLMAFGVIKCAYINLNKNERNHAMRNVSSFSRYLSFAYFPFFEISFSAKIQRLSRTCDDSCYNDQFRSIFDSSTLCALNDPYHNMAKLLSHSGSTSPPFFHQLRI